VEMTVAEYHSRHGVEKVKLQSNYLESNASE